MMLLGQWRVAVVLGLSLCTGGAFGQAGKPRVVQPDDGPPPEQAVQADTPAQYEHAGDPEPFPQPEPPETVAPVIEQAIEPPEPAPALTVETPSLAPVGPQNQLQKDTSALLQLAQDLKAEIEKAGGNTLSLVAIRKADEIQRLSRNLKERMKDQEQVPAGK